MEINIIRRLDMDRTLDTTKGWIWTGHWTTEKITSGLPNGYQGCGSSPFSVEAEA